MTPNQPNRNLRAVPPRALSYAEWADRIDQDVELALKAIKSQSPPFRPAAAVVLPEKPPIQRAAKVIKAVAQIMPLLEETLRMRMNVEKIGGRPVLTNSQLVEVVRCLHEAIGLVLNDVRRASGRA